MTVLSHHQKVAVIHNNLTRAQKCCTLNRQVVKEVCFSSVKALVYKSVCNYRKFISSTREFSSFQLQLRAFIFSLKALFLSPERVLRTAVSLAGTFTVLMI